MNYRHELQNTGNNSCVSCLGWRWHGGENGGGGGGGGSPEVHYHLYSFEHVQLQVVVTAPDSQLLNLLFVSRLVTVLDEANDCSVICKLQEFDRGVFRGAVICVERE